MSRIWVLGLTIKGTDTVMDLRGEFPREEVRQACLARGWRFDRQRRNWRGMLKLSRPSVGPPRSCRIGSHRSYLSHRNPSLPSRAVPGGLTCPFWTEPARGQLGRGGHNRWLGWRSPRASWLNRPSWTRTCRAPSTWPSPGSPGTLSRGRSWRSRRTAGTTGSASCRWTAAGTAWCWSRKADRLQTRTAWLRSCRRTRRTPTRPAAGSASTGRSGSWKSATRKPSSSCCHPPMPPDGNCSPTSAPPNWSGSAWTRRSSRRSGG